MGSQRGRCDLVRTHAEAISLLQQVLLHESPALTENTALSSVDTSAGILPQQTRWGEKPGGERTEAWPHQDELTAWEGFPREDWEARKDGAGAIFLQIGSTYRAQPRKDYRMIRAVLEGPERTARRSIIGCSSIWRWERLSPEPDSPEVEPGMGIQVHTACWECLGGEKGRGGRTESPASLCPWLSLALAWPHRQLYNMHGTIFIPLEAGPVFYTHICRSMTGLSCRVCPPKYHRE